LRRSELLRHLSGRRPGGRYIAALQRQQQNSNAANKSRRVSTKNVGSLDKCSMKQILFDAQWAALRVLSANCLTWKMNSVTSEVFLLSNFGKKQGRTISHHVFFTLEKQLVFYLKTIKQKISFVFCLKISKRKSILRILELNIRRNFCFKTGFFV
jgi:hypothetical protein